MFWFAYFKNIPLRNLLLVAKAMILKHVLLLFAFRNLWIKKAAHPNNHAEK